MQCVMNLTIQFFFVYLLLWVLITYKQFQGASPMLNTAISTFDSARATVMCATLPGCRGMIGRGVERKTVGAGGHFVAICCHVGIRLPAAPFCSPFFRMLHGV